MKTIFSLACAGVLLICQSASGQGEPPKPSEEHKMLKATVGTWDVKITMAAPTPEAKATSSTGVETVKMHGDFWTIVHFEYEFRGQRVAGHGLIGYDPQKKKFVGTWHETTSPYMANMEGEYDKETKAINWNMKSRGYDGKEMKYKIVMKQKDENHRSFEMHMPNPAEEGKFIKMMKMDYTKKK